MTSEPDWVPPGVDTRRANTARVYDYLLGGTHNFLADQDVARTLIAVEPSMREHLRANRDFVGRAVRFMASEGVRHFLDIGSGIPTEGNVHEIAQRAAPGSKVLYVDSDPVAVAHSEAMLYRNDDAASIQGDLREPGKILASETTRRLIDFARPVGVILGAVLHFIPDTDQARRIVRTLTSDLAAGSYLAISHGTSEGNPKVTTALETVYNRNVTTQITGRTRAEILGFFDGLDLLEPGLVTLPHWRPDPPGVPENADKLWGILAGVARQP